MREFFNALYLLVAKHSHCREYLSDIIPSLFAHLQKYDLEEEISDDETQLTPPPQRPVPKIDGATFIGSTIRPKGRGDVPMKPPSEEVSKLMRKYGLVDDVDGKEVPKYSWPAMGPSAVRASLSYQLNRFWNPRNPKEFPASYTSNLDAAEVLTDGFPYPQHDKPVLVKDWLAKCAKSLEAEKSIAASRILGVDKKGMFSMSKENQLRSLAVVAFLSVADHTWLDSMDPRQLLVCGVLEPEEVFIKPEMHPQKKVATSRWRAIWHCSAQAELTVRLLHDAQNKTEIAAFQCGKTHSPDFPTFGSCPGMGHHDEGLAEIIAALKRLRGWGGDWDSRRFWLGHLSHEITVGARWVPQGSSGGISWTGQSLRLSPVEFVAGPLRPCSFCGRVPL